MEILKGNYPKDNQLSERTLIVISIIEAPKTRRMRLPH